MTFHCNFFKKVLMISFLGIFFSAAVLNALEKVLYQDALNNQLPTKEVKVRVLLDEKKGYGHWKITTQSGIMVTDIDNHRKKNKSQLPENTILFKDGSLWINGKRLAEKRIRIDAISGFLMHDNKTYQGSFLIIIEQDTCLLINNVGLEDYVCGVLRAESWPGWPLEVNKVFAIASRTYVFSKILETGNNKPYHIKNTNIHQTYNGLDTSEVLKKAVAETKGIVITYDKKPIIAMFDSCCGGIIPAHLSSVDFNKFPYLARTKVCDFCKPCKIYQWQWELEFKDFEKILQAKGYPIHSIKEIKTTKDKAGAVQEIIISWAKEITTLTGKQFYALSTRVKSFCYSIEMKCKKIIIKGRGYGHHLGLCQWGARRMIDHGWNHCKILEFFFPQAKRMILTLK